MNGFRGHQASGGRWSGPPPPHGLVLAGRPSGQLPETTMGILCDSQIRELIGIEPFEENTKRPGRISFGVSSYGYDLRVGSVFKSFTNVSSEVVGPKRFSGRSFVTIDTEKEGKDYVLIPPNSFALCETVETVS